MLGDEDSPVVEFTVSFESNLLLLFVISSSNVVVGSWYTLFLSLSNLLVADSLLFALCRVSEISRDFTVFPISLSTCGPSVFSHSVPLSSTCPWPSSNPLLLLSGSLSALTSASSLSSYVFLTFLSFYSSSSLLVLLLQTLYLWGLLFQEIDYGQTWWKIPVHLLCAIVIQREHSRLLLFDLAPILTFSHTQLSPLSLKDCLLSGPCLQRTSENSRVSSSPSLYTL